MTAICARHYRNPLNDNYCVGRKHHHQNRFRPRQSTRSAFYKPGLVVVRSNNKLSNNNNNRDRAAAVVGHRVDELNATTDITTTNKTTNKTTGHTPYVNLAKRKLDYESNRRKNQKMVRSKHKGKMML